MKKAQLIIGMFFITILIVTFSFFISAKHTRQSTSPQNEKDNIKAVLKEESDGWWEKDFKKFSKNWAHEDFVRRMGWWKEGGISVVEGWDDIAERTKNSMAKFPDPSPQITTRKNWNIRISDKMAWVTFDQYGKNTGEDDMEMPGLSHESRILEKINGEWKIVYMGYLLEE